MQIDGTAPPVSRGSTVRGLGACDALQLELRPIQRERLGEGIDALALRPSSDPLSEYERRLVALMRAGVPPVETGEAFAFVGPAGMVGEIVRDSARRAVQELRELVDSSAERALLQARAADAAAWIRTFLDWQDVEWFSLDPDVDPAWPW